MVHHPEIWTNMLQSRPGPLILDKGCLESQSNQRWSGFTGGQPFSASTALSGCRAMTAAIAFLADRLHWLSSQLARAKRTTTAAPSMTSWRASAPTTASVINTLMSSLYRFGKLSFICRPSCNCQSKGLQGETLSAHLVADSSNCLHQNLGNANRNASRCNPLRARLKVSLHRTIRALLLFTSCCPCRRALTFTCLSFGVWVGPDR